MIEHERIKEIAAEPDRPCWCGFTDCLYNVQQERRELARMILEMDEESQHKAWERDEAEP